MNNKVARSILKPIQRILSLFSLGILAILAGAALTGMAWNQPLLPLAANEPTITPILMATSQPPSSWWGRFLQPTGDPASLTLGIIIMGGVIVLIILGGTFAVTRRKY